LLDAIDWVLANHSTYNIQTVNLSLGDSGLFTTPCSKVALNPFLLPITDLRDIGITVVASSGNNGYVNGVSMPACTPGVISVGAVYDADVGSRTWSACSDAASAADQVTCFSNSAYFLSTLAPGALITAGGYNATGTSQAGPHVAGAAAVLAAAQPLFSPDEIANRLTSTGVTVIDGRNGLQLPRLDLAAALAPEMEESAVASEDVPFLPPWALFALGFTVVLIGLRKQRGP
jgi:subtilisin family serine protease